MVRFLIAAALVLTASAPALAQDMPLSQILIDGEGWKKVEGKSEKPKADAPRITHSPDGGTMFLALPIPITYLHAATKNADGSSGPVKPYAPLRVRRFEQTISVTALATDKDGRIYAATELGIQVFDPTGRLCGVVTAPEGKAELMAFDGDKLTVWVGNTKYTRKLNTTGVK